MIVVDANILIVYGLADEPQHSQAIKKLAEWHHAEIQLAAPRLFRSEITAVMRKSVFQERLTLDQGRTLLARLLAYPIEFH